MYWTLWIFVISLCGLNSVQSHDRIAPGVPPQHYQQPPPPSHHGQNVHQIPQQQIGQHQQPMGQQYQVHQNQIPQHQIPQQQIPQQQQQQQQFQQQQVPPVQQAPQQVPHAQVPNAQVPNAQVPVQHQQGHGHGHGHDHSQPQQILNAANIAHEKAHIAEHSDVPIDTSKMSEQELQFHYFKMHDADNNNKLDGCELIKSLIHWHEEGGKEPNTGSVGDKIFKDEDLVTLIDPILEMDDTNKDGYIDYPEFIQAQQKAAANVNHQ